MLKNVIEAKFNQVLIPIAKIVLDPALLEHVHGRRRGSSDLGVVAVLDADTVLEISPVQRAGHIGADVVAFNGVVIGAVNPERYTPPE